LCIVLLGLSGPFNGTTVGSTSSSHNCIHPALRAQTDGPAVD
jgi:hypothetical protein